MEFVLSRNTLIHIRSIVDGIGNGCRDYVLVVGAGCWGVLFSKSVSRGFGVGGGSHSSRRDGRWVGRGAFLLFGANNAVSGLRDHSGCMTFGLLEGWSEKVDGGVQGYTSGYELGLGFRTQ